MENELAASIDLDPESDSKLQFKLNNEKHINLEYSQKFGPTYGTLLQDAISTTAAQLNSGPFLISHGLRSGAFNAMATWKLIPTNLSMK